MSDSLSSKHCVPCEGDVPAMSGDDAAAHLAQLSDRWAIIKDGKAIEATFEFKGYCRTTAFVNAVVWIASVEAHHPDVSFGYNTATVLFETHAADGLTENDFICAAKVDALLA